MRFDTKVVRGGISPDPTTGAIVPPIYQTATYVLEEVGQTKGYDYTRSSNPTRATLEDYWQPKVFGESMSCGRWIPATMSCVPTTCMGEFPGCSTRS